MKYLLIYAHPHHEGHNGYLLKQLENKLQAEKLDYEVLDLYKINFSPLLTAEDLNRGKEQAVSSEVIDYQEKIQKADRLVFIYPTWWQGPPAILRGFIDRVFLSGFAYEYSKQGVPNGLLKNKKAAVFTTTGSPKIFSFIFTKSISLKLISQHTLKFCGIKSKSFLVGSARKLEKNKLVLEKMAIKILAYLK